MQLEPVKRSGAEVYDNTATRGAHSAPYGLRRECSRPHLWRMPWRDEKAVFDELCEIVEEAIELYHKGGKPLPPPTSGRDFANKMQSVA